MTREELIIRMKEVEQTKRSVGFKIFTEFLNKEQLNILGCLSKCSEENLKVQQGRLKELIKIKSWLKLEKVITNEMIENLDGQEVIDF